MLEIKFEKLKEQINNQSWQKSGDSLERAYYYLFDNFANCENFWRYFVVPSTQRVLPKKDFGGIAIRQPKDLDEKIAIIGNHNYVIFLHIIYCHKILKTLEADKLNSDLQLPFSRGDYYTHLVSILDNFEQLVLKFYSLIAEVDESFKPTLIDILNLEKFLEKCTSWYKKTYKDLYENYKRTGRFPAIKVDKIIPIITPYIDKESFKKYENFSQKIRQTRNLYVHGIIPGGGISLENKIYQPKHDKMIKYKDDWRKYFRVNEELDLKKKEIIDEDFILSNLQMKEDLKELKDSLQNLYEKILKDLDEIGYKKRDNKFWAFYQIEIEQNIT